MACWFLHRQTFKNLPSSVVFPNSSSPRRRTSDVRRPVYASKSIWNPNTTLCLCSNKIAADAWSSSAFWGMNSRQCLISEERWYLGRWASGLNLINSERAAHRQALFNVFNSRSTCLFPRPCRNPWSFLHEWYRSQAAGPAESTGMLSQNCSSVLQWFFSLSRVGPIRSALCLSG